MKLVILVLCVVCLLVYHIKPLFAANPILVGKGVCDPHVRIYNNRAWLYATHDASVNNTGFTMHDWWVWSSTDLVNWTQESTLRPEETYHKAPSTTCWATDSVRCNRKYYFYFSMGVTDVGVVVGDTPKGPWRDPLGKALLPASLTPTEERDPGIIMDDDGNAYIVFGVWDFYIARLNKDMISLAEAPRKIELDKKDGPYGPGKTDDKPYLHKYKGNYYLSWGCFYAMSDSVYGPYTYKGSVIVKERTAPEFQKGLTMDRHGCFFELYNQWYFMCNDQSWPGSHGVFRNSVISYVHYRDNGEIEPVTLDAIGVGEYDAASGRIEAENYFKAVNTIKRQSPEGGFEVRGIRENSRLVYPNVRNISANSQMSIRVASANLQGGIIEVHANGVRGKLMGQCQVPITGGWSSYKTLRCKLKNTSGMMDITLVFKGQGAELMRLDWLSFE
ncbi:MAG: family 43 glycosylhydrolase [Armatimonadota bacterium]